VTNDVWLHTLEQLCSEVDRLTAMLEHGSSIVPKLRAQKLDQGWELVFEEVWPDDVNGEFTTKPEWTMLEDQINWITAQLEKQKNCVRIDAGAWQFQNKRDAEKFITLYHLTWTK
jgi:hypothetical protein